jgi:hypothetical protein
MLTPYDIEALQDVLSECIQFEMSFKKIERLEALRKKLDSLHALTLATAQYAQRYHLLLASRTWNNESQASGNFGCIAEGQVIREWIPYGEELDGGALRVPHSPILYQLSNYVVSSVVSGGMCILVPRD